MNLLVTGGCGFIGSNFVRMMLAEHPDVRIINMDALTYAGNMANLHGVRDYVAHEFVLGDIRSVQTVRQVVAEYSVDGIINFAAESHVDRSIEDPSAFVETNVTGTLNLLHAAVEYKVPRFLQVSTDEVYGSLGPDDPPFTETTLLCPNSPYSASKAAADHMVHAFGHTYGLHTVITRCSNNYGPYQFPEKMLPLMFNNAQQGQPLPVYGDGLQVRDWIYVYDHCAALWAVWRKGVSGEVYNVGGGNEVPNIEMVRKVLRYCGRREDLIEHIKDRPGHDRRYAIDSSKLRELGWEPSVSLAEGLDMTLQWYSRNKRWLRDVMSGAYREYYKKMYGSR